MRMSVLDPSRGGPRPEGDRPGAQASSALAKVTRPQSKAESSSINHSTAPAARGASESCTMDALRCEEVTRRTLSKVTRA